MRRTSSALSLLRPPVSGVKKRDRDGVVEGVRIPSDAVRVLLGVLLILEIASFSLRLAVDEAAVLAVDGRLAVSVGLAVGVAVSRCASWSLIDS